MFDSFQPWFVKKLNEQNVCCCTYHVEMEELTMAFNNMKTKVGLHPLLDHFNDFEDICQCAIGGTMVLACTSSPR